MKTTNLEQALLRGIRQNNYNSDDVWMFVAINYSGECPKRVRCVVPTLITKGLIKVEKIDGESLIHLTPKGKNVCFIFDIEPKML